MDRTKNCEFWKCSRKGTHKVLFEYSKNFTLALLGFTQKENHTAWYCDRHFREQMENQGSVISEVR